MDEFYNLEVLSESCLAVNGGTKNAQILLDGFCFLKTNESLLGLE